MTHDRNQSLVKMYLRNRLHCSSNRLLVDHRHTLEEEKAGESTAVQIGIRSLTEASGNSDAQ